MTTTIAAIAALWFTSQSLRATDNQYNLSQQVAVTDRFQKAVQQLTSDNVDIRLSGIYLLERLAKDSPTDHETVFAVLSAFLRTHTTASACETPVQDSRAPVDTQAVLTVIGRRDIKRDKGRQLNLDQTCLAGMESSEAELSSISFQRANLTRTNLSNAHLTAFLYGANLSDANLSLANLTGAYLGDANLTDAFLYGANLSDATLHGANLTNAGLSDANLSGANLAYANLTGTSLTGTSLTGANLTGANLTNIYHDDTTRWPDGYTPPKSRPSRQR